MRERPDLALVDLPLWESVRARIAKGHALTGRPRARSSYLLTGILVCARCGAAMQIMGTGPVYYHCPAQHKGLCSNRALLRTKQLVGDVFWEIASVLRKAPLLREAIEAQEQQRGTLQNQIEERTKVLVGFEDQIDRLLELVSGGGTQLDYAAEKLRRLECDARLQKAEIAVLRSTEKTPLRQVTAAEVIAAVARMPSTKPDDVEPARARLRRWTGNSPMRFDGHTLTIHIVPRALVLDVAHDGAPLPSYPESETVEIRLPAGYLCARPRTREEGMPRARMRAASGQGGPDAAGRFSLAPRGVERW